MEFQLREWHLTDVQSVAENANNPRIAENLRNGFPFPYSIKDAEEYIKFCIDGNAGKQLCRAICVDGNAVGSIGTFLKDDIYCKSAEIGYWLGEDYWGKGIMREAIRQICAEAFSVYDIVRIFAEPFAHNTGSRKALEYSGFQLEGVLKNSVWKNGALYDSCIYALLAD